jgi:hypothetical protein
VHPVARSLLTIYCSALVAVPAFAVLLGQPIGPWAWGTGIVLVTSIVALIVWVATSGVTRGTASDPAACTCGYVGSIGGRDPACPVHGQDTDPPAGSVGVTMNRATGGPHGGSSTDRG